MDVQNLPTLNAVLNSISAFLLIFGYLNIRSGRIQQHRAFMISALITSALFLTSYLFYHQQVGSVPYPHHDWTRTLYFTILIPHIILAALMVPFIITIVILAFREKFATHRKIARWVFPVWLFVSVSGVVIYVMLYIL
ncbi:DUF420 domain-containing protein [bacterium]|nr:DUF420 domain-containing protein [bacterium]